MALGVLIGRGAVVAHGHVDIRRRRVGARRPRARAEQAAEVQPRQARDEEDGDDGHDRAAPDQRAPAAAGAHPLGVDSTGGYSQNFWD